jgi:hypothetical protein
MKMNQKENRSQKKAKIKTTGNVEKEEKRFSVEYMLQH